MYIFKDHFGLDKRAVKGFLGCSLGSPGPRSALDVRHTDGEATVEEVVSQGKMAMEHDVEVFEERRLRRSRIHWSLGQSGSTC